MKKFYAIGLGVVFFALMTSVNGQNQKNESTGVTTLDNSLKSTTIYDLIRLRIENEYVFDATVIYYYETFSDERGPEDSDKMFNSSEKIPEIFTRIDNSAMAINGFSDLDGESYISVPISVRNRVWNECTISANLEDFRDDYDVVLEDVERGHFTNLRTSLYTYTPSVLGTEHERFILHLTQRNKVATGIESHYNKMDELVRFTSDHGLLEVSMDAELLSGPGPEARIDVFTRNGKKLTSRRAVSEFNQIELAGGQIYIVRVTAGDQLITKKVAVR